MINYDVDAQGIATITWAMTDSPMNVLNADSIPAYAEAVERAIARFSPRDYPEFFELQSHQEMARFHLEILSRIY